VHENDAPTRLPTLETARLTIRRFQTEDLDPIHRILDVELANANFGDAGAKGRDGRERWLRWTILGYDELELLYQPPYGDRAVVAKETGELIGAAGFVPSLGPFDQLPAWVRSPSPAHSPARARMRPEVGLYYALAPSQQRRGYAVEAADALVDWAFRHLGLARIVATTTVDNAASIAVMRRLGMSIQRNPLDEPPWFQIVGVLESSSGRLSTAGTS